MKRESEELREKLNALGVTSAQISNATGIDAPKIALLRQGKADILSSAEHNKLTAYEERKTNPGAIRKPSPPQAKVPFYGPRGTEAAFAELHKEAALADLAMEEQRRSRARQPRKTKGAAALGAAVATLREEAAISLESFAMRLDISPSSLETFESGGTDRLSRPVLRNIGAIFGCNSEAQLVAMANEVRNGKPKRPTAAGSEQGGPPSGFASAEQKRRSGPDLPAKSGRL